MACRSFGFSTRLFSAHTSLTVRCEEQNKVINNRRLPELDTGQCLQSSLRPAFDKLYRAFESCGSMSVISDV